MNWMTYALLSAVFAGATAILAKVGVAGVSANAATLVRTAVVLAFAAGVVFARGEQKELASLSGRTWTFLILSGLATGLSWLFYFAALKHGQVAQVAPIDKLSFVVAMVLGVLVLREKVTVTASVGAVLIVAGVLLTLPEAPKLLKSLVGR